MWSARGGSALAPLVNLDLACISSGLLQQPLCLAGTAPRVSAALIPLWPPGEQPSSQTLSFSSSSSAELAAPTKIHVRTVAAREGRSGYPESRLLISDELQQQQQAPAAQAQRLKVPLVTVKQSASAVGQTQQQGPGEAAAAGRLDATAVKVFDKFVGCLTKDGKKSVAQGIMRDTMAIIQARLAQGLGPPLASPSDAAGSSSGAATKPAS